MVSCPPHMNPCVYGIDFPDRNKLMAANHSLEEIRQYPERRFAVLSVRGGHGQGDRPAQGIPFAWPATTAIIPCPTIPLVDKHIMERRGARTQGLGEELAREELQTKLL